MKNLFSIYLLITILLTSCVPQSKILYLQNLPSETELSNIDYEPILKQDDLLHIQIKTLSKESSDIFNLNNGIIGNLSGIRQGYLIDKNGYIDFPILGRIKASGFKKSKFEEEIKLKLKKHLLDFSIEVRLANYKISVMGEVNQPGEFLIETDRITILQAIAKAGDLTVFADRKKIHLYREENNKLKSYTIDLTKSDFIPSDIYYLRQNDIINIDARRSKADNVAISSNITTTISIISSLLTLYLVTTRL
jgi:polysaccharide export outer membrane protein